MVCQMNCFHSTAAEAPSNAQQDELCVLEIILIFLTEFPKIVIRISRKRDLRNATDIVDSLTDTSFEVNVFRRNMKGFSGC